MQDLSSSYHNLTCISFSTHLFYLNLITQSQEDCINTFSKHNYLALLAEQQKAVESMF